MSDHPIRAETIRLGVLGLLVVALGSAVALVLAPFVVSMLWAGILAFATWPLYVRLLAWTGGRDWASALFMTLLMAALVVLPTPGRCTCCDQTSACWPTTWRKNCRLGACTHRRLSRRPRPGPELMAWLEALLAEPLRWQTELKTLMGKLNTELWTLLGGVGKNIVKLGMSLFTLFFAYLHGLSLLEQARTVLKGLLRERTDGYLNAVGNTTSARWCTALC